MFLYMYLLFFSVRLDASWEQGTSSCAGHCQVRAQDQIQANIIEGRAADLKSGRPAFCCESKLSSIFPEPETRNPRP